VTGPPLFFFSREPGRFWSQGQEYVIGVGQPGMRGGEGAFSDPSWDCGEWWEDAVHIPQPALHTSQRSVFFPANGLWYTWPWVSSGEATVGVRGRWFGCGFDRALNLTCLGRPQVGFWSCYYRARVYFRELVDRLDSRFVGRIQLDSRCVLV